MVQTTTLAMIIASIAICFLLPIGSALFLVIKKQRPMKAVLVGAAVFFVFQLILRIPIVNALSPLPWFKDFAKNQFMLFALVLALTAGIFEEVGRLVGYKLMLKNNTRWIDGVAFGIGHGGIEAIMLVGFANINNLILSLAINSGTFDAATADLPKETAELLFTQLTQTPSSMFLMGGLERISTFFIHIAFSILVLYAVKNRKYIYVLVSILLHTLVNMVSPVLQTLFNANIYVIEVALGVCALLCIVYIIYSRRHFGDGQHSALPLQENAMPIAKQ